MATANENHRPDSYETRIDTAVTIGDKLMFSDYEKAHMLGLMPYTENIDALIQRACMAQSLDVERRCDMIISINDRLSTYGDDAMRVLQEGRPYAHHKKTYRELIVSGDYWQLHYASLCLRAKQ